MDTDARAQASQRRKSLSTGGLGPVNAPRHPITQVLIIEDDPDIVALLTFNLTKAGGFNISIATDGSSGLEKAREQLPGVIVLDLLLPGMPGFEVCKILKTQQQTKHIPIIILTAKADVIDRIVGFELGADDYVTKPFSARELLLRINAILKRGNRDMKQEPATVGAITVDPSGRSVSVYGKPIKLTVVEFKLLHYLVLRIGRVEPRDRLLAEVWGYDHSVETRTIDTHIQRLRRKLGEAGEAIETIRGFGYRFRGD
jgi:two-component system phosphate regulon response regulator PhoB